MVLKHEHELDPTNGHRALIRMTSSSTASSSSPPFGSSFSSSSSSSSSAASIETADSDHSYTTAQSGDGHRVRRTSKQQQLVVTESPVQEMESSGAQARLHHHHHQQQQQQQISNQLAAAEQQRNKSPVLIKYNYYDSNGARHEQENCDVNHVGSCATGASSVASAHRLSLSPSFRQNLDEIVRSRARAHKLLGAGAGAGELTESPVSPTSSSSSSGLPEDSPLSDSAATQQVSGGGGGGGVPAVLELARRYKWSHYEQRCLRCQKTVYQMDKVGPLKDFTFYHQNCFKCRECGTKLTLKTYFNNQHSHDDKEVYCHRHCPKTPAGKLDNQSVGIRAALNAPKVFDPSSLMNCIENNNHSHPLAGCCAQQQQPSDNGGCRLHHHHYNYAHHHHNPSCGPLSPPTARGGGAAAADELAHPNVDASAMHIQHAVRQTRLLHAIQARPARLAGASQAHNHRSPSAAAAAAAAHLQSAPPQQQQPAAQAPLSGGGGGGELDDESQLSQFISNRLEYLEPKQKLLEARHRKEEEALFRAFERKWRDEERRISDQIRAEWQIELAKLLQKYEQQLSSHLSAVKSAGGGGGKEQLDAAAIKKVPASTQTSSAASFASGAVDEQVQVQRRPQMSAKNGNNGAANEPPDGEQQRRRIIELERANLEKCMTIKLDRKKETLKRKLRETERQATAELVEKQSREMLSLISMKLEEYKEKQKRKIGADLEQFEAIEALANQLGSSLQLAYANSSAAAAAGGSPGQQQQQPQRLGGRPQIPPSESGALTTVAQPPPPRAPEVSKMQLYNSERADEVFHDIDRRAINVAREDQQTFTDLVHHLTRKCLTDVEKVRAIFRWITVKNLNTMQFDSNIKADTPLGLLRGIKQGSESYHVLFKRLCSYAGLHCVVIKGYSKSAGYQPGVRFEGSRFRNSWNAVHVAGAWRFVQCNWGARHLVSVAVMQDKNSRSKAPAASSSSPPPPLSSDAGAGAPLRGEQRRARRPHPSGAASPAPTTAPATNATAADTLRYEYDDHYFLTDPDEFIYEFYPLASEWQLLKSRPISLHEFEQLPFVRSLFFKYGLYFVQRDIKSVLYTDSSGATTIKIGMPTHMVPSLIFHYNLKHFDSDSEQFDGVSLKRFVMQSVESGESRDVSGGRQALLSNIVSFRVHVPENGAYILDIFANSTTATQYITGEPMKFKSVCKFKIVARNLKTVMIPLPDCASGEFGPMKATRLFGIIPLTHENGLISVTNEKRLLEIQFRVTRPLLDFMASLHKNQCDERHLSRSIRIYVEGDVVCISVRFPEDGQYGLDIYTRDETSASSPQPPAAAESARKHLLTHCCKYLINVRDQSCGQK